MNTSVLNTDNITKANEKALEDEWGFNCWGGTLYVLGKNYIPNVKKYRII